TRGAVTSASMINVSSDKTMIAWSTPSDATVTLLRVLDWGVPTLTYRGVVPVKGSWPVISPNSDAFAILTTQKTPGSPSGNHVAFYSISALLPINAHFGLLNSLPSLTTLTNWIP